MNYVLLLQLIQASLDAEEAPKVEFRQQGVYINYEEQLQGFVPKDFNKTWQQYLTAEVSPWQAFLSAVQELAEFHRLFEGFVQLAGGYKASSIEIAKIEAVYVEFLQQVGDTAKLEEINTALATLVDRTNDRITELTATPE